MKQRSGHLVDILFTLALFCVFAACALMVVIMGADVYSKSVDVMQKNFDSRTSLSYIATKLRQGDGGITVQQMDADTQALVLEQTVDGAAFRTWIYSFDGQLREIFTLAELRPAPNEGQPIMALSGLTIRQGAKGPLTITVLDLDGKESQLLYTPRAVAPMTD